MSDSVYMAYNLDINQRNSSSSGGLFPLFAQEIIEKKGCVYGAAYRGNGVSHIRIDSYDDINELVGSKYIQSNLTEVYRKVIEDIQSGKVVLFSGVPCQIAAIKCFLASKRINSENIYYLQIVCHGIPNSVTWSNYLREVSKHRNVFSINLCDKKLGWSNRSVRIGFSDGSEYLKPQKDDYYFKAYTKNWILRPSCYECFFKQNNSGSDITIGDFWRYDNFDSDDNVERGCSMIIVHTDIGRALFEAISSKVNCKEATMENAIVGNPYLVRSVDMNPLRNRFFDLQKKGVPFHRTIRILKVYEIMKKIYNKAFHAQ